ncbi:MAG: PEP-CTERM sorting domain-containing protein [Chthoniobacteraceae bacterium]
MSASSCILFKSAFVLAASAALLLAPLTRASTVTWDGGGADDNYGTAANWVGNVVPLNNGTADLVFAGTTRLTPNLAWSGADLSVNSITFASGAGAFVLTTNIGLSGDNLLIGAGGITNNDNSVQTITTGIAADYIAPIGDQSWNANSGALSIGMRVSLAGNLTLGGAFAKTFSGGFDGNFQLFLAAGTLNLTATQSSALTTITVQSGSTLNVQADQATGSAFLSLAGGTVQTSVSSTFNNNTVFLSGGVTNTLAGAGTMSFNGLVKALSASPTGLNITNTNSVGMFGGLLVGAGSTVNRTGPGTLFIGISNVSSDPANSIAGTLNLNSGTTDFSNPTTLTSGGNLNINGATTVVSAIDDLTIGSGASVNINAGTFTLSPHFIGQRLTVTVDGGTLTSALAGAFVLQDGGGTDGTALAIKNGGQALITGSHVTDVNQTISVSGQGSLLSVTGDFALQNGNAMNVTAGGDLAAGGRLVVANGSVDSLLVDGAGSKLTIGGASAVSSVIGTGKKGTVTIENFATGTIGNTLLVGNAGAGSNGELNVFAAAQLTVNADLSIGSFTTGIGGAVNVSGVGAQLTVAGANNVTTIGAASGATGNLTISDGGSFTASSAAGGGTVVNPTGTITINGGSADLGVLTRNGSGHVVFNSGSLSFGGNLNVSLAGLLGQGVTLDSTRALTLTGTTTVEAEQNLAITGGSLTTGTLTTNGAFTVSAGTATLTSGALTVVSFDNILPATASISGTGNLRLANAGAVAGNIGTITFSGGTLDAGNAPLTATAGGTINYQGNTLINGGVLGGTGTHFVGAGGARFNGGTLAAGATLQGNNSATYTDFNIAGTLLAGLPLTLAGTTTVTGVLNLSAGSSVANGPVTISGSGGVNIFSGALTANALLTANSGGGIFIAGGAALTAPGGVVVDGGAFARAATGFFDPGAFTITGGGQATFAGGFDYGTAHTTTVTGIGSQLNVTGAGGDLFVDAGSTMNLLAGAQSTVAGRLVIGNNQPGTMLVDGPGSQLTVQSTSVIVSVIGSGASSTLTIGNLASVNVANEMYVGNSVVGSAGIVNVQSGGGYNSTANVNVGNFATAGVTGTVNLTGAGTTFNVTGATSLLTVGAASGGTGTINVGIGATLNSSGAGTNFQTTGTVNVNGGTANFGTVSQNGGHVVLNSGTVAFNGGLTLGTAGVMGANLTLSAGRNLAITGGIAAPAGQTLTVNGGTLSTFSVGTAGTTNFSAGSIALTGGQFIVQSGGVATISGSANLNTGTQQVLTQNGGTLNFSGANFNGGFNSIRADAGGTVNYNSGATISGGFLRGAGTHSIGAGGANLSGTTFGTGTTLALEAGASTTIFTNATGAGRINVNSPLVWDGGQLSTSGTLAVGASTASLKDFFSDGVMTIASGGTLVNSSSSIALGGGSRTTVNAGGAFTVVAGTTAELNGGLLVNNGAQTGVLNINYGGLAKGAGSFGTVNVADGGKFSPGNSPGTAMIASMSFLDGGSYLFEMTSAAPAPGVRQDLLDISGGLAINAGTTPNSRFTIQLLTIDLGNSPVALSDFDAAIAHSYRIATATGGITGFSTDEFAIDTSGFLNPTNGGTFSVSQAGNDLFVNFIPVPEPSSAMLLILGGLSAANWRRNRKAARMSRFAARQ